MNIGNLDKCLSSLKNTIKEGYSFLLLSHVNYDADALCSLLLMAEYLGSLNKEFYIFSPTPVPEMLHFIDGYTQVKNSIEPDMKFDTVIILDCGDMNRTGDILNKPEFKSIKNIINIDHHPYNTKFGRINCIAPEASATWLTSRRASSPTT